MTRTLRLTRTGLRLLGGPIIFGVVLLWVDVPEVLSRLGDLHPGWVGIAVAIGVAQTLASAWRWRFTAGRLGIGLPLGSAVREYWLAGFLNQVIPGGVVGDVSRAIRHARGEHAGAGVHRSEESDAGSGRFGGRVVHAVILERLSGQVVVAVAAVVSVVVLLTPVSGAWAAAGGLAVLLGVMTVRASVGSGSARSTGPEPRGFAHSLRTALLDRSALPVQLVSSVAVVGSYVATYLAAARAVGVETPFTTLLPLVTPVLLAMLIPVSVAGWGVREGAAAAIWASVGLAASDGVAISVAYGLLVLVSTLPGAVVLVADGVTRRRPAPGLPRVPPRDPDRTGGPPRVDDVGPPAAAHRTGPRPGGD